MHKGPRVIVESHCEKDILRIKGEEKRRVSRDMTTIVKMKSS